MRIDDAFADRITAAVLFSLGGSMTYGGYVMDRLEIRQIHPASIPGLVPMALGVALMVCALLLAWGTKGASSDDRDGFAGGSWFNLLVAAGWSCIYALFLVGWLPFAVATAIYLAVFAGWFLWCDEDGFRPLRTGIIVVIFSVTMATGIALLFRYGFLVRLP